MTKAERKLLLIPVVFIFLRIWDIIGVFLFVYLKQDGHNSHHYYWLQLLIVSTLSYYVIVGIKICELNVCTFIMFEVQN